MDLLAADAEQANRGFSRAPSPLGDDHIEDNAPVITPDASKIDQRVVSNSANSDIVPNIDAHPWRLEIDVALKDYETIIFRNFTDRAALWVSHSFCRPP